MRNGSGLAEGASPSLFEPVRQTLRFEIPPAILERLSDLARIPAHYRPTFANSIVELFAKAHRWHRMATRSVEMDAAAKELDRVVKEAQKLKKNIDKLSEQARMALGLYALRLDQFGEADSHETVRNQIEALLQAGSSGQAVQKVDYLSWAVGRIGSAAATVTWSKQQNGSPAPRQSYESCKRPHVDTFNRFIMELGEVVRACNGAPEFEQYDIGDGLRAFLKAASSYLPNGFTPKEVLYPPANGNRAAGSPRKGFMSFWLRKDARRRLS
jgi:hypothetical protein